MSRIKGPHTIEFGADTITDIEEVNVEWTQDSNDYDTVQGNKFSYDTTSQVIATLTLLANDVTSLRVVLPQYFVANGETLSTGEVVNDAQGVIDVVPAGCVALDNLKHVVITSCDETGASHVLRIPDCTTRIDGVEFDGAGARKVMVQFRGEGETIGQLYDDGAVTTIS
jgi:hypothetical protein